MIKIVIVYLYLQIPGQFVDSILEVHGKYTELIKGVFHSDQQFVGALDKVGQCFKKQTTELYNVHRQRILRLMMIQCSNPLKGI